MNQSFPAPLGVMEIFFGSPWPEAGRLGLASFLKKSGFSFYLYGPKADSHLRKGWREEWPAEYQKGLANLSREYRGCGLEFGVCFSPFGTQERLNDKDKDLLKRKLHLLNEAGLDSLGIFFDDMPSSEGLAARQIEVLSLLKREGGARLLFCPSYYSFDPILDRVFGTRPEGYLEEIAEGIPKDVGIFWTGPKVLSDEISAGHLKEVSALLGRKPYICDNFYANDGPKNCKFLKLRWSTGRSPEAMRESGGWAFNPMNQLELSKVALLSTSSVFRGERDPEKAFAEAVRALCPGAAGEFLLREREILLETGLDKLPQETRERWLAELASCENPALNEVRAWLLGGYTVGSECLTD